MSMNLDFAILELLGYNIHDFTVSFVSGVHYYSDGVTTVPEFSTSDGMTWLEERMRERGWYLGVGYNMNEHKYFATYDRKEDIENWSYDNVSHADRECDARKLAVYKALSGKEWKDFSPRLNINRIRELIGYLVSMASFNDEDMAREFANELDTLLPRREKSENEES